MYFSIKLISSLFSNNKTKTREEKQDLSVHRSDKKEKKIVIV